MSENKGLTFYLLQRLKTLQGAGKRERKEEAKDMTDAWEILFRRSSVFLKFLVKFTSLLSCAGCQFPPPSSQAGASLAAVHSPALHNMAASQTPL